jgi:hypothetical protein
MTAGGRRVSTTVWIFVWLSTSAWGQALQNRQRKT